MDAADVLHDLDEGPRVEGVGFAHVMGTCRMGDNDDGTCVTDRFGRVWGTDNLYLATVGLIPTPLAVNRR